MPGTKPARGARRQRHRDPGADFDVAARIGHDQEGELVGEGMALGRIAGLDGVMLPDRLRRNATPDQRRLLAHSVRLTRAHIEILGQLDLVVAEMRRHGLSWGSIGWVTGLTEAGARKRWSAPEMPTA